MARRAITTAADAAADPRVLAFGHLQGAANRLEYILGSALERECGISHQTFEVLLILARAGADGLGMREIAQERVLSTGGVTRLIDRMEAAGLVARSNDPNDRRGRRVTLTPEGERMTVQASRLHAENIRRYFLELLPAEHRAGLIDVLRTLSHSTRDALPRLR